VGTPVVGAGAGVALACCVAVAGAELVVEVAGEVGEGEALCDGEVAAAGTTVPAATGPPPATATPQDARARTPSNNRRFIAALLPAIMARPHIPVRFKCGSAPRAVRLAQGRSRAGPRVLPDRPADDGPGPPVSGLAEMAGGRDMTPRTVTMLRTCTFLCPLTCDLDAVSALHGLALPFIWRRGDESGRIATGRPAVQEECRARGGSPFSMAVSTRSWVSASGSAV